MESGILGFGIRNPCAPEKDLESRTWNPESTARKPEFKTILDSLTWEVSKLKLIIIIIIIIIVIIETMSYNECKNFIKKK